MKPNLGVCYYPEHWPESQWHKDASMMRDSGIEWVRIGEFAWSKIEPEPGEFDWEWLDRAISVLGENGLKIVLGTPTATPPRWLVKNFPDMLAVDINGCTRQFGSRRHYDFSHLGYRRQAARISRLMAERYGSNPHVCFWQIDNEYGCHETTHSYSDAALNGFRQWLSEKYNDIEILNQAWGNIFWSMEYQSFNDIELPNLSVTEANPSHWQDFHRYSSEQVRFFNKAQIEAIRQHDKKTPALHNYMGGITDFDHFAVGEDLQAASWDSYPLGFLEDRVEADEGHRLAYMRQGDPDYQAFHHDLYRAVGRGRWWVMEQQPGPVNWAPYNPVPLDGMVRLWSWEAIAHGAEVVSFFRWRQAPFAQEQMHAGLLRPDGQAATGLSEVQQLASELQDFDVDSQSAKVAIVFDYESSWAWKIQPQGEGFNYLQLVFEQYRALRSLGISIDFLPADCNDFSAYDLLVIPGLMYWNSELLAALQDYDGVLLIGPRSGSKNKNFCIPMDLPPACPDLIDIKITHVESLRPNADIALTDGGKVRCWREYLNGENHAQPCLSTVSGEAVLMRQNDVFYLGACLDDDGYSQVMRIVTRHAGLQTVALPAGLRVRQWGNFCVAINYSNQTHSLDAIKSLARYNVEHLEPAGVSVGELY